MKRSKAPSMLVQKKRQAVAAGTPGASKPIARSSSEAASAASEDAIATTSSIVTTITKKSSTPVRRKSIGLKRKPFKSPLRSSNGAAVGPPAAKKKPLAASVKSTASTGTISEDPKQEIACYEVFWTKRSNKKHKNYCDGMRCNANKEEALLFRALL